MRTDLLTLKFQEYSHTVLCIRSWNRAEGFVLVNISLRSFVSAYRLFKGIMVLMLTENPDDDRE